MSNRPSPAPSSGASDPKGCARREFLRRALAAGATLAGALAAETRARAGVLEDPSARAGAEPPPWLVPATTTRAPSAVVSVRRATSFDRATLAEVMSGAFDEIGGIEKLVRGKTVTVKLNITGDGRQKLRGVPASESYQTHPHTVEVLCGLLDRAGAKRIVLVESYYRAQSPREILGSHGWNLGAIEKAGGQKVHFEDTRNRGAFEDYAKVAVPFGGYAFPAYHLNRRYVDTDVCISLAKMKNHITAGVTGAVKNLFGIAPTSLYGADAPNEETTSNRGEVLHFGSRRVPAGVTEEHRPERERLPRTEESYYRVPLVTADLIGVRPIDLAIVEGIATCRGGEGPWCGPRVAPIRPGLLLVGRNAVNVDAVMTALMGYDPTKSTKDDVWLGYNHLELLARAGVGTNDPAQIEIAGVPLAEGLHEFFPGLEGWVKTRAKS